MGWAKPIDMVQEDHLALYVITDRDILVSYLPGHRGGVEFANVLLSPPVASERRNDPMPLSEKNSWHRRWVLRNACPVWDKLH